MSRRTTVADPGAVLSYALRLCNRDFDRMQVIRALLRDDHVVDLQRRAGYEAALRFVENTVDKALVRVASRPAKRDRSSMIADIAEARLSADARPWPGRTGPDDRRVLEGAYISAEKARSTAFGCSLRTWGLRVGLPWSMCRRSLERLVDIKAITIISKPVRARGVPGHYTIAPFIRRSVPGSALPPENLSGAVRRLDGPPVDHDAFRPVALGSSGWLILRRLDHAQPIMADELSAVLGLAPDRTRRTLRSLEDHDLTVRCPDGWSLETSRRRETLLDLAAVQLGTAGALERDRKQYERDRARWRSRGLPLSVTERRADVAALERGLADLVVRQRDPEEAVS